MANDDSSNELTKDRIAFLQLGGLSCVSKSSTVDSFVKNPPKAALFDKNYVEAQYKRLGIAAYANNIITDWLLRPKDPEISPTPFLDIDFYKKSNRHVEFTETSAIQHFLNVGLNDYSPPSAQFDLATNWAQKLDPEHELGLLRRLLRRIPGNFVDLISSQQRYDFALTMCEGANYRHRRIYKRSISDEEVFWNHCFNLDKEIKPSLFFDISYYKDELLDRNFSSKEKSDTIFPGSDLFLHWLCYGIEKRIVPTRLFDERFYRETSGDLADWSSWIFRHFIFHGKRENVRRPNKFFDPAWYIKRYGLRRSDSALMHYIVEGDQQGCRPGPMVATELIAKENAEMTRFEEVLRIFNDRRDRLESPAMNEIISRAAAIEPLIFKPYGSREIQLPPIVHKLSEPVPLAKRIRQSLPRTTFDNIVIIPQCRMAGSARVVGFFVDALASLDSGQRTLIVQTDLPDFERPDWFPQNISVLNIPALAPEADKSIKLLLLIDIIRGLSPKFVMNVNSRLAWDMYVKYGRQLSQETRLCCYLFTWDLDIHGNKAGYPIREFPLTFDMLAAVLLDNTPLEQELVNRFHMGRAERSRMYVAHTPAFFTDDSASAQPNHGGPREGKFRFVWAGRFDRQKRFDIVIEIARQLPDVEIVAYGKPVLGDDYTYQQDNLPGNVKLAGTFETVDELRPEDFDGLLLTSQWEGLPIILVEAGMRKTIVIASNVGGVSDLIRSDTGYPVADPLDVSGYVGAINEVIDDMREAKRRAENLQTRTAELCSPDRYRSVIQRMLEAILNG